MALRYFTDSEFAECNPPCNKDDLSQIFLELLDSARHLSGVPFILTSGFRSKIYEIEQGRDGSSSHTKGLAVDIKADNSVTRFKIINALISVGFNRIGIGKDFIHVDMDKAKPEKVLWHYYG
jgi:uncharacterized protein YcbK (DUF882 family)